MIGSERITAVVLVQRKPAYFLDFTFVETHHAIYHYDKKQQENKQANDWKNLDVDDAFQHIRDDFHKFTS